MHSFGGGYAFRIAGESLWGKVSIIYNSTQKREQKRVYANIRNKIRKHIEVYRSGCHKVYGSASIDKLGEFWEFAE